MRLLDSRTFSTAAAFLLAAAVALTQVACDSSGTGGGGDYSQPLTLSGVRYQSPDSTEPPSEINPGDLVVLKGENMNAVQRVYLNGVQVSFNSALASAENLLVSVPGDLPFGAMDPGAETFNTVRVANRSSEATLSIQVLPPAPVLQGISNEQALPGEQVTLTGNYLYLIESVALPGGTTIPGEDIEAAEDGTSATFTIPEGAGLEEGALSIATTSGTDASAPSFVFQDSRGLIFNADDAQNWQSWSALKPGDSTYTAMASTFRDGAKGEFVILSPQSAVASGDNAWWTTGRSINLNATQWVAPANLGEPLENFALKFEMNIRGEWGTGNIRVFLPESNYAADYQPWMQQDGSVNAVSWDGWRTVTVPMTEYASDAGGGTPAPDLGTLLTDDGNPGAVSIRLRNDGEGAIPADLALAVDNIRVVRVAGGEGAE